MTYTTRPITRPPATGTMSRLNILRVMSHLGIEDTVRWAFKRCHVVFKQIPMDHRGFPPQIKDETFWKNVFVSVFSTYLISKIKGMMFCTVFPSSFPDQYWSQSTRRDSQSTRRDGRPWCIYWTTLLAFQPHPRKLTWIPKMLVWKRWFLLYKYGHFWYLTLNFWVVSTFTYFPNTGQHTAHYVETRRERLNLGTKVHHPWNTERMIQVFNLRSFVFRSL